MIPTRKTLTLKVTRKIENLSLTKKGYEDLKTAFLADIDLMKKPKFDRWMLVWMRSRSRIHKKLWKEIRKQVPKKYHDRIMEFNYATGKLIVGDFEESTAIPAHELKKGTHDTKR